MRRYRDDLRKKRYGQYFSGRKVANLLVALLPYDLQFKSIIDPMVGSGDLLFAAKNRYPCAEEIVGIDIDREVLSLCKTKIPDAEISIEDAFTSKKIKESNGWDLVITNPPYVRYQTLKTNGDIGLPNGEELRQYLLECITESKILDKEEKGLYLDISKYYSGLSDMAVPSWILCASIVKKGGYLAMVVPETWLNRDYALPIHYLLLRCFEIIVVAKDIESVWFENAEIRTCLVIARRKSNEQLQLSYKETLLLDLNAELVGKDSLVDNLFCNGLEKYDALEEILRSRSNITGKGFSIRIMQSSALFPELMRELELRSWIREEDRVGIKENDRLPKEIKELVESANDIEYNTLEECGWCLGQGMRTGANDFFYATIISESEEKKLVQTGQWHGKRILVDPVNIRRTLKNRREVKSLCVDFNDLNKCIFYIQGQVRKADLNHISNSVIDYYDVMDAELDDYISDAENYISPSHKKSFRELSAVKPNEKKDSEGYVRFWYMLPPLKERHIPNLCVPRICGNSVEALYIRQSAKNEIVVDANFTTLWNSDFSAQMRAYALLNSTWVKCYLEVMGTAMGGGALKIEASHVRKLLFPKISQEKKSDLETAGKMLLAEGKMSSDLQERIDEIITSPYDTMWRNKINQGLRDLLNQKIKERTGR